MQDGLRELLRDSRIKVSCGAEVDTVEKALDSVGGFQSSGMRAIGLFLKPQDI